MKEKAILIAAYIIVGGMTIFGIRLMEHIWPRESVVKIIHYICVVMPGAAPNCRELTTDEVDDL